MSNDTPRLPPGREHIECDAPDCTQRGPPKRCSRCHRAFYCSVACQKKHWKNGHKEDCSDIDEMKNRFINIGKGAVVSNNDIFVDAKQELENQPRNTSCFICLSEVIVDPYTLPNCGHTFCFGCLQTWQGSLGYNASSSSMGHAQRTCPACRREAPDLYETVVTNAMLCAARARKANDEGERSEYIDQGMKEIGKIDIEGTTNLGKKMEMLFTYSQVLKQLGKYAEALEYLKKLEAIHIKGIKRVQNIEELLFALEQAEAEGREQDGQEIIHKLNELRFDDVGVNRLGSTCPLYLTMAECHEGLKDYQTAGDTYKKIFDEIDYNDLGPPPQQRMLFMGMSRCAYHVGKYEMAINLGRGAIEMNRYFPQVHKYVALAQRDSGDTGGAIETMGRAVNYETPWDEANQKVNLDNYLQMVGGDRPNDVELNE